MNDSSDLLLDLNILARATQKYYDRQLQEYDLTYAQLPVLLMIYESEGITANQIVTRGQYDKGTVTKNVQKLESLGYIESRGSTRDKRVRHLYPTDRTKAVISRIYAVRRDWWEHLMQDIPAGQKEAFMAQTRRMVDCAVEASNTHRAPVVFYRQDSLSTAAWPGRLSMVLYGSGCNFRCPGCPDTDRVVLAEDTRILDASSILDQLSSRRGFLDGVVISGGEPFLQPGLTQFLRDLKHTGIPTRLETNGTFPDQLALCLQEDLVASCCLRLRGSPRRYARSAGLCALDTAPITRTMELLEQAQADWEIRLELDDTYFEEADLAPLAAWTQKAPRVQVVNHSRSPRGIDPKLGPMPEEQFAVWKERLEK